MSWNPSGKNKVKLKGGDVCPGCKIGTLQITGMPGYQTAKCLICDKIFDAQTGKLLQTPAIT